jgi:hypothetical protein
MKIKEKIMVKLSKRTMAGIAVSGFFAAVATSGFGFVKNPETGNVCVAGEQTQGCDPVVLDGGPSITGVSVPAFVSPEPAG